jgi:hypothetical protein
MTTGTLWAATSTGTLATTGCQKQ